MDFQLANLQLKQLMKHTLKAFCEVNILFHEKLEIYGSVHVRADDQDVMGFLLNERALKQQALYADHSRTFASRGFSPHERSPGADAGTPRSSASQHSPRRSPGGKKSQTGSKHSNADKTSIPDKTCQGSSSVEVAVASLSSAAADRSPKDSKCSLQKSGPNSKLVDASQPYAEIECKRSSPGETAKGRASGGERTSPRGVSPRAEVQNQGVPSVDATDIREFGACAIDKDTKSNQGSLTDEGAEHQSESTEFSDDVFNTECLSVEVVNNVEGLDGSADCNDGECAQPSPGSDVTRHHEAINDVLEGDQLHPETGDFVIPDSSSGRRSPASAAAGACNGAGAEPNKTDTSDSDIKSDADETEVKSDGGAATADPSFDDNDPDFIASLDETIAETFLENPAEPNQPDSILWIEGGDTYDTGGEANEAINHPAPGIRDGSTHAAAHQQRAMYARIEADNYVGLHRAQAPTGQAGHHPHQHLYAGGGYVSRGATVVPVYIPVVRPEHYSAASQRAVHAAHLRQRHPGMPHVRITTRGPIRFTRHPTAMHRMHHPRHRYPSTMFHPVVARPLLQPNTRPTQNRMP